MINKLLMGVFKLVIGLVNVILTPINLLITNYLPSLSNGLALIRDLFNHAFTYVGWVLDSLFVSRETISLLIAVLTMRLTIPLAINSVKLAVKWYNALKL